MTRNPNKAPAKVEIIITGLRIFSLKKGAILAAEKAGKHKTVSQMIAIFAILGFLIFRESLAMHQQWSYQIAQYWKCSIDILMYITVALTLFSGITYVWNNRSLIRT